MEVDEQKGGNRGGARKAKETVDEGGNSSASC